MGLRSELLDVERAIRQRWPIGDARRRMIVEQMVAVLESSDDDRAKVRAANVLLAMEAQNQKDEQVNLAHAARTRFLEIAERLGLSGVLGITSDTRASSDSSPAD